MYSPSAEEFIKLSSKGNLIPVYREILADMETPVSAYRKIAGDKNSFLFESVVGGEKWGRYSFLGSEPTLIFKSKDGKIELLEKGETTSFDIKGDPLHHLKELMSRYVPVKLPGLPRFFGGAVGYIGYDMVKFFEKLPDTVEDDLGLPDALLMITDTIIIFDNVNQKIKVVSNAYTEGKDIDKAYKDAVDRIEAMITRIKAPLPTPCRTKSPDTLASQTKRQHGQFNSFKANRFS